MEADAVEFHVYANPAVPGLLQTKEYARAVFGMMRPPLNKAEIEPRVAARLLSQEIFAKHSAPLMSFVIDGSVPCRPIGGRTVQRDRLERVPLAGHRRTIEVRMMPLDSEENTGLAGQFNLIETSEGSEIAYVEVQNTSHVHTERRIVCGPEIKCGPRGRSSYSSEEVASASRWLNARTGSTYATPRTRTVLGLWSVDLPGPRLSASQAGRAAT